jgi:hypothetical protein
MIFFAAAGALLIKVSACALEDKKVMPMKSTAVANLITTPPINALVLQSNCLGAQHPIGGDGHCIGCFGNL